MSVRSFRPVIAVASVAAAALSCYLVSLRVASERAALEDVETSIVLAQRDIRTLQTEIGTRGRLEQLERWNVRVLALSAPKAEQFVDGGYQLARLARPSDAVKIDAPVLMASAPKPRAPQAIADDDADVAATSAEAAPAARSAPDGEGPASIMHVASYQAPKVAPKSTDRRTVSPTTKIASAKPAAPLSAKRADGIASVHKGPAKTGTTRETGTH